MPINNLTDFISKASESHPSSIAFIFEEQHYTYLDLIKFIVVAEKSLIEKNIKQNDIVGVTLYQDPFNLIITLALAKIGAISVRIHPLRDRASRLKTAQQFKIKCLISPDEEFKIEGFPYFRIHNLNINDLKDFKIEDFKSNNTSLQSPFRIAFSTGSTGEPKGVMMTHQIAINRIKNKLISYDKNTRMVPFDLNYALGFVFAMGVLEKGGCIIFLTKHQANQGLWTTINAFNITDIVLSPGQVLEKLNFLPNVKIDFPSIKHFQVVGDKCPPQLVTTLKNRVTNLIFSTYGISEIGGIALADLNSLERYPGVTGAIHSSIKLKIVNHLGHESEIGEQGEIWIKSDSMPDGYFNNKDQTKLHFTDGWFRSGDIGRINDAGYLFLEGRSDTLLNIGGQLIDPILIESIVNSYPDVTESFVFAHKNLNGINEMVLVISGTRKFSKEEINTYLTSHMSTLPTIIKFSDSIPKESNGKIARQALAEYISKYLSNT